MLDEQHFHQQMLAAYRELVPEGGTAGETLIRKLAEAMFIRGARIDIGAPLPPVKQTIHHSIDCEHRFMWVCKLWAQVVGVRPHSMIGRHISEVLTPTSMARFLDPYWPTLLGRGRAEEDVALVTVTGITVEGHAKGEALRDSDGSFMRSFTRIVVFLPRVAGSLIPLGLLSS